MIAKDGKVDADGIPGVDHLRPFISSCLNRRRDRIAAERKNGVRILCKRGFLKRQKPGKAAAGSPVDRGELIDVVDVQYRDTDVLPKR